MRKLLLSILLSVSGLVTAQKGNFEIGFSTGLNTASVSHPDDERSQDTKSKMGFNFGLTADYFLSDQWSLRAKLVYDQKGLEGVYLRKPVDQASGFAFREYNSDFELDYLTVPITANFHFGKRIDFSFGIGGYVGFLLDSNEKEHQFQEIISGSRKFSTTDFGAVGTFVAKYPLTGNLKIGLEYEYQHGLSELYHPNFVNGPDHFNSRHSINFGCYYSL